MRSFLPCAVALLGAALFLAPGAGAQGARPAERVLRTWVDPVKLGDGRTVNWHHTVTYDAVTGETIRTTRLDDGTVVTRVPVRPIRPTLEEIAEARALILAHPEIAALTAPVPSPLVEGGFVILRNDGGPCGEGSRCLQFEVANPAYTGRDALIRYVLVDLRAGRVLDADFQPALEGNRF
ncbi:MAG TPA: hypothetical protein VD962_03195 [Rubricoccaceae bacterium]|nr:hypothetical protein [Rubricoccaceae bacterium]